MSSFIEKSSTAGERSGIVLPRHIAIIMDGNGRWAQKRGFKRSAGHAAGAEVFRSIATYCRDIGVRYLTVYAFSTENWKRSEDEVNAIMSLLETYLLEAVERMERDGIRVGFFGDTSVLSPRLRELADAARDIAENVDGIYLNICLNYGGRAEIVRAAQLFAGDCAAGKVSTVQLDEAMLGRYMYSGDMPDPDLIIRPGGEKRISNFLLWQGAYSEMYFTDTLWPDFKPADIDRAIEEYSRRTRKFGAV